MTRNEFRDLTSDRIVILDGATGTELATRGMPGGVCPELWVYENPGVINEVQQAYFAAGADIVYVPSFGGNPYKLEEFGLESRVFELNKGLAEISRKTAGSKYVFGDIAPTGNFIFPFGDVPFDAAVNAYKRQVEGLVAGGVDGFVIETMMDVQEARAALIAIRETCDLPVMVSMTFEPDGRTLTGNDPVSALITFQSLGADAFGCNCSTGPRNMIELIRSIKDFATIPLLAKPNAGMPKLINGQTVFGMGAEEFGSYVDEFIAAGVNILGGCCGTTPEHIKAQAAAAKGKKPIPPQRNALGAVSSARANRLIGADQHFAVIGERINPTGKKALQAELREGKLNIVRKFAQEQTEQGAAILDVNMGLSGIDEKEMMLKAIALLSQSADLPLCIDSTRPEVMEAALRVYPGRALLNSISAEKERIEEMLPIAAKYGAMLIVLPLTDAGIPETTEERIEVVKYIYGKAQELGYHKADICVDGLIMTVSSNQSAARVSLDLIDWCANDFGVNTVCGLSNVSFGMPQRQWVNNTFLGMALGRGLNMAIANPSSEMIMATVHASDVLTGRDRKMSRYVALYAGKSDDLAGTMPQSGLAPQEKVFQCVLQGDDDMIAAAIAEALDSAVTPRTLVDDCLIPAINKVGDLFEQKKYFLPQLIMSADAMRKGFEVLEPLLQENAADNVEKTRIIIATVKGDIHDIGKNIVALMLRNYGYEVIDLGKDVSADIILDAAVRNEVDIVCLSALMTTTMVEMETVVNLARERGLGHLKFMVGGAVVDKDYAEQIGANYSSDAMSAVKMAHQLSGK